MISSDGEPPVKVGALFCGLSPGLSMKSRQKQASLKDRRFFAAEQRKKSAKNSNVATYDVFITSCLENKRNVSLGVV